jgi:hypothetical protein
METIKTDPFLIRQYITARILKRIVATLISGVLTSGITSWDKVLSKVLFLVLQAALVARAGDMARSQAYEGQEYIRFEHVQIKLVRTTNGNEALVGLVKMEYWKGEKYANQPVQLQAW